LGINSPLGGVGLSRGGGELAGRGSKGFMCTRIYVAKNGLGLKNMCFP